MNIKELYMEIGGDYAGVLRRLPNDEYVTMFAKQFASEATYSELIAAIESGNITGSFESAHKLKGVTATMGFTPLNDAVCALVEQLRTRTEQADAALTAKVTEEYERIIKAIASLD